MDISHIKDKNHLNDINSGTITVYYIQNFAKARDIFEKGEIIKHFMKTNIYGIKEVVKREFTFIQMIEVSTMEAGTSFGEYALLNKKKRSASVRTLEKTHFATLDSEAFNDVMLQIKKKESDMKVDFLNMYTFLANLTYTTKAKLAYRLKEKQFTLGQLVYSEESDSNYVYFIENGEFEIWKELYLIKNKNSSFLEFK